VVHLQPSITIEASSSQSKQASLVKIIRQDEVETIVNKHKEVADPKSDNHYKLRRSRLRQGDPIFVEYELPFSATPYYDYLDNFLLGLKLETTVPTSGDCVDVLVYTLDDWAYLQNNITDYNKNSWEAPILNFTRMVGGNFSYVPSYCYEMLKEIG